VDKKEKRIMVDMSATLIHHGHIRLLKKAKEYGKVVVGLTTDEEIRLKKGYEPELTFEQRKEVLEAIKYVDEVVSTPWLLDEAVLEKYKIDLLVHGNDNSNDISEDRLLIFPRTEGVSSSSIRERSHKIYMEKQKKKNQENIKRNVLLNPGPATTTNSVKLAQVVPDICPREKEFGDLMAWISDELTEIVANNKDYTTILFGGSGTAVVEAVLSSVVPHNKKVLIVNNGAYGKRMCQIADAYDINYVEFESSPMEPIDLEVLENTIKAEKNFSHLAMIHNETTTGLLNSLDDLGALAKKYNLELIVDAMSSYAAIPIDMKAQNISYLMASSNKNIQGMAGVGFVIANKADMEKTKEIKPRNFYLNLYAQYENFIKTHQMRFTPPVQTLYALKQAIIEAKEEGIDNRYKRYSKSWERLIKFLKENSLAYIVDEKYHSKIITSIFIPEGMDFNDMHDYFYERGFTIYPGKVENLNTFRIANIGDIDSEDMEIFLKSFKEYLYR
jgi:2-aminoethylphosphonate-pyruvate transaminase